MRTDFDLSSASELDARTTGGVDVRLLWQETSNSVCVQVLDRRTGDEFLVGVDGADALDAFKHPFAYASAAALRQHPRS